MLFARKKQQAANGSKADKPDEKTSTLDEGPDARYRVREKAGWVDGVARFTQRAPEDYGDIVILAGECPRCTHQMEVELPIERRTGERLKTPEPDFETLKAPFAKTASCNCRGDHEDRPENVLQGCGAFGRIEVGEPLAPERGIVRVRGRPSMATLADVEWERKAERLEGEDLASARATGEKWTATVSSLTGVLSIVALIKGPEDVSKLPTWGERVVIGSVGLAVSLAVVAIILGALAAYGLPRQLRPLGGPLRREQAREARKARQFVAGSVASAVGAVIFLAAAIGVTWGATPEDPVAPPEVLAVGEDNAGRSIRVCGELQSSPATEPRMLIREEDAADVAAVSFDDLRFVTAVAACP